MTMRYVPVNGLPVGDYDTVIDDCGVEWFFDQSGHLDVFGSDWPASEVSGYLCDSFDEAIGCLIDDGYIELTE